MKLPSPKHVCLCALFFLTVWVLSGCSLLPQLDEMGNFTKCQFRLASVENTTFAGIPLRAGSASQIGMMDLLNLQQAYASGTLPLRFTLNVEVKNPNPSPAGMSKMAWILFINGTQMTTGTLEKSISIAPNDGVGNLPMDIALDLKKVLSGKSLDAMIALAMDVAGEGTQPTKITLHVKPSMVISGRELQYPGYVTISHEFPAK